MHAMPGYYFEAELAWALTLAATCVALSTSYFSLVCRYQFAGPCDKRMRQRSS
jgi:hypothetical protein